MTHRKLSILLCIIFSFGCISSVLAYSTKEHNKDYETVMFGNTLPTMNNKRDTALKTIEYSLFLALDFTNNDTENRLQFLRDQGVNGLPQNENEFSFNGNQYHERYTHLGWDFTYPDKNKQLQWLTKRKPLLLASCNNALDFGIMDTLLELDDAGLFSKNESAYSPQCVSFAALLYYVHLLGDHIGNDYSTDPDRMPLGRINVNETNPDIIFELQHHLGILFRSQKKSPDYLSLFEKLRTKSIYIRHLAGSRISKDNYEEYQKYAEKTLKLLETYVPRLLKNEPFFANVFYSN